MNPPDAATLMPLHIPADGGERLTVFGETVILRATGEHTGGAFTLLETLTQPGAGTPPHVHHREHETFQILEGEVEFHVGGQRLRARVGETAIAPRGVPHNYTNVGPDVLRMLVIAHPAGIEHFFRDAALLPFPPDPAQAAAVCEKHGLQILPPWEN